MADEDTTTQPETQKKGSGRLIVTIVVLLGTVAVAGVGGAILGGQLIHSASAGPADAEAADSAEAPEVEDSPVLETVKFAPIIVDFRSDMEVHHLKVGIAVEIGEAAPDPKEAEKYVPRGREAVIAYLRTLSFQQATSPKEFEKVRQEISQRVTTAMGEERVSRVLITDYVAQ